jgi:hypothetical protein
MKKITIEQLSMFKAKLEIEAKGGRSRIKVRKHQSFKIDVEEYVSERTDFWNIKDQLKKELYDESMTKEVVAVYRNEEFVRTIDPMFKSLYEDDVRIVTVKQVSIDKKKKESKIQHCERLCRKKENSFAEISMLQDMLEHICKYENNERMNKLRRDIEKSLDKFFI